MQSKYSALGFAGILLLVIGLLVWVIRLELVSYAVAPLVLGGILVLIYIGLNLNFLMKKLTGRMAIEGANLVISIVIFLAIVVFLEMLFMRHSARFDFTEVKKYSLASQTIQILEDLDEEIHGLFLIDPNNPGQTQQATNLLDLYTFYSDNFTYEVLDPDKNPEKVEALAPVTMGSVYLKVQGGERHEKADGITENDVTNALLKLVKTSQKIIYFTTGHNELSTENTESSGISDLKEVLIEEGYKVETIQLAQEGKVPEDAAMVISPRPQTPFFEAEIEALKEYLTYGGSYFVFLDPQTNSGLEPMLNEEFGVVLGNNWVVEQNPLAQFVGAGPVAPLISSVESHPIVEPFGNQVPGVSFPIVRTVEVADNLPPEVSATAFLKTSQMSWAETNIEMLTSAGEAGFDEGEDVEGPVSIAVAVSKPAEEKITDSTEETDETSIEGVEEKNETRIVVFGDSDFLKNNVALRGLDLFLNSVNWLASQEDLISVRPKDDTGDPLFLTPVQFNLVFYITLIAVPLLVAILGIVVILLKRFRG